MEIIFKEENGKLFGSTKVIGIGKRQPKLIYGEKAKKLREDAHLTVEQMADEFDVRANVIKKIESQQMALDEKMCNKYMDKFNVNKEYFFDLDLETLILNGEGHILKTFETSEECKKVYDEIMEIYFMACVEEKNTVILNFEEIGKERGNE